MKLTDLIFILVALCFSAVSCSVKNTEKGDPLNDSISSFSLTSDVKYDTCLIISHQVDDFEVWKAAYDLASEVRKEYGIKTLHTLQGATDPKTAMVITHITDFNKAREYITSSDVRESMRQAGVEDSIQVYWLKTMLRNKNEPEVPKYMVLMTFNVLSYDRWEKAYVEDAIDNPTDQIFIHRIFKSVEPENSVSMLFSVDDPDVISQMEKDNAMKMKMMAAGVVSYPEIHTMVPVTY